MAGFLKRVRRLTLGKINAFLDGAENPEQVFPQLVEEMREECKKAIQAEATATAAHKRRQHVKDRLFNNNYTRDVCYVCNTFYDEDLGSNL